LRQDRSLDGAGEVWSAAAQAYDRLVAVGARARLESTVGLLRSLAVSGGGDGLGAAQEQRLATIRAAEELGDPLLTARVIGAYDVPAVWPRADDPARAAEVVAAARRTLEQLPDSRSAPTGAVSRRTPGKPGPALSVSERARLLATVAVESRGTGSAGDRAAAEEAVRLARRAEDPGLLVFALNGLYMQTFYRCGLAADRDAIGAEIVALAARHGLPTAEVLGHLIRLQTQCALGDAEAAAGHADEADRLAARHELPLVTVFTTWFRASRRAAFDGSILDRAGMPGLTEGLLPLALATIGRTDRHCGPYEPWVRGRPLPPPHDPMAEVLWCLTARAALRSGDRAAAVKARDALRPAAGEHADNGLVTMGPISAVLADLDRHIDV